MPLVRHHFRRHILESTTKSFSFLLVHIPLRVRLDIAANCPAEVANLDLIVLIDEQILWFEVPVDNVVFVNKVNACNSLNKVPESLILRETLFFGNFFEKILLRDELHY